MRSLDARLARLEARWLRPPSHHTPVASVLWDVTAVDHLTELPCPCGQPGYALKTVGMVRPQPCATATDWDTLARDYYA